MVFKKTKKNSSKECYVLVAYRFSKCLMQYERNSSTFKTELQICCNRSNAMEIKHVKKCNFQMAVSLKPLDQSS